MTYITEIIPDSIPAWAKDAFDDGQFFRIAIERVEELESNPWEKLYKEAEAEIEQLRSKLNGWVSEFLHKELEKVQSIELGSMESESYFYRDGIKEQRIMEIRRLIGAIPALPSPPKGEAE